MILAIDTSGSHCGVALWEDGLVALNQSHSQLRHNEVLLDQIQSLLVEHKAPGSSLSAVAVSSGPGSFTGLRVGMAAAKGLCWTWTLPFIAIPTLEGLAEAVPAGIEKVLTLMPARARDVYWALFEHNTDGWRRKSEDQVSDIQNVGKVCEENVFLFGEGYIKHKDDLDRIFAGRRLALPEGKTPDALAVSTARLAARRWRRGDFDDLMQTEPKYCYSFPRRKK